MSGANPPLRILLAALGGEGGGVLMNWIVGAARQAGHGVQATSVPGVAQRTGSTSYYVEIAGHGETDAVLSLVPMQGRVDVVVSSELIETARAMAAGFVSPRLTTLISSTARFYSTAEKIIPGDGRYCEDNVRKAAAEMAKAHYLLDLGKLAEENGTFVSATMFGALAGSGVLPWPVEQSRALLSDARSRAGFDAAVAAIAALKGGEPAEMPEAAALQAAVIAPGMAGLPESLRKVVTLGVERVTDYLDVAYGDEFLDRVRGLIATADLADHRALHALTEACRRLALWMAYEDVARVADLKTRPERFRRIRDEVQMQPGQVLTVTEYLKPRLDEIADILPRAIGRRVAAHAARGGYFPFLGRGRYIRSNGIFGYRLLRFVAGFGRIRRRSYRFHEEQAAIDDWLEAMHAALPRSPDFAMGLGELPRVLKGYSDTLQRGKSAYARIMAESVRPAIAAGLEAQEAGRLRAAIGAALADETHAQLDAVLTGNAPDPVIPQLKGAAHA
ncbi:indolepyruvate oxidoreductase subunit beta family protein [Aquicoccus sp. G2-2]|uniref:indolepyruvate oxidoreductase subunit beta family protein n=1 Tax=Aquicoccus sp. G2-2 TaxID=3092120 RepID=UPI002ADF39DE|nr:indolepyruvate oxidoreductase subunit beta family protein [Aquicoccus sp. G2-2]MEA1113495.1 indolepyruvate oxidoreductase subunit beta family protein [Aquicoccus sp. G2-2]